MLRVLLPGVHADAVFLLRAAILLGILLRALLLRILLRAVAVLLRVLLLRILLRTVAVLLRALLLGVTAVLTALFTGRTECRLIILTVHSKNNLLSFALQP